MSSVHMDLIFLWWLETIDDDDAAAAAAATVVLLWLLPLLLLLPVDMLDVEAVEMDDEEENGVLPWREFEFIGT